jgi:hypothetical protein
MQELPCSSVAEDRLRPYPASDRIQSVDLTTAAAQACCPIAPLLPGSRNGIATAFSRSSATTRPTHTLPWTVQIASLEFPASVSVRIPRDLRRNRQKTGMEGRGVSRANSQQATFIHVCYEKGNEPAGFGSKCDTMLLLSFRSASTPARPGFSDRFRNPARRARNDSAARRGRSQSTIPHVPPDGSSGPARRGCT